MPTTPKAHATAPPGHDTGEPEPHALANELTEEPGLQADGRPVAAKPPHSVRDHQQVTQTVTRSERRVGRTVGLIMLGIACVAIIVSAVLFRQWNLLGLGLIVVIPFMILLAAPYWLAMATKTAQDTAVHKQRGHRPS